MEQYKDPKDQIFTKEEIYQLCGNNRYFQTVLVAYYKLTRNKVITTCIEDLKDKELLEKICDEYIAFLSGQSVQVGIDTSDETFSLNKSFVAPEGVYVKEEKLFLQELQKVMNAQ